MLLWSNDSFEQFSSSIKSELEPHTFHTFMSCYSTVTLVNFNIFYRNILKNLIIGRMYFLSTWYLSNTIKLIISVIISFVNHLYNIKIDEIHRNCILFNKKSWHYIHNLLLYILRDFLKMSCFFTQIKLSQTIENTLKSIKIALNDINRWYYST